MKMDFINDHFSSKHVRLKHESVEARAFLYTVAKQRSGS